MGGSVISKQNIALSYPLKKKKLFFRMSSQNIFKDQFVYYIKSLLSMQINAKKSLKGDFDGKENGGIEMVFAKCLNGKIV